MSELALKIKANCFAGSPLRILDQTLLDFSKSQASRNFFEQKVCSNFCPSYVRLPPLMVDLQIFPKVLPTMEEIVTSKFQNTANFLG